MSIIFPLVVVLESREAEMRNAQMPTFFFAVCNDSEVTQALLNAALLTLLTHFPILRLGL